MSFLKLLKPGKLILGLWILLGLLSSAFPYGIHAATKITWDEYRGLPYTFLKLTGCYGPCYPNKIGHRYWVQDFDLFPFLMNTWVWYVLACFVVYALSRLIRNEKVRAIVTESR
ncbi:MAG: hypothetical protein ABI621_00075 [Chloroflexota bacterium]